MKGAPSAGGAPFFVRSMEERASGVAEGTFPKLEAIPAPSALAGSITPAPNEIPALLSSGAKRSFRFFVRDRTSELEHIRIDESPVIIGPHDNLLCCTLRTLR